MKCKGVYKYDLERLTLVFVVVIFAKAVEKIINSRYSFSTKNTF
jgi:hypothetical protein